MAKIEIELDEQTLERAKLLAPVPQMSISKCFALQVCEEGRSIRIGKSWLNRKSYHPNASPLQNLGCVFASVLLPKVLAGSRLHHTQDFQLASLPTTLSIHWATIMRLSLLARQIP